MHILSWNVNGLRSLEKSGDFDALMGLQADVICLQETKAEQSQLSPAMAKPAGYEAYFSSSKVKKGYSGVGLYTKPVPRKIEYGMGIPRFDDEGRMLIAHYDHFVLLNVYFPNGGQGPHRLAYKLEFYDAFLKYIDTLRKKGLPIIFCGDVNTAHEEIDLARPHENEERSGFLPEERAWLDEVVNHGYIDVFRSFYPGKIGAYTYWDMKSHARDRNVGWRIDYFFVSPDLMKKVESIKILDAVMGSDHCPILIDVRTK